MRRTFGGGGSRLDRKSVLLGSAALLVGMAVSGAAQAQCTTTGLGGFAGYNLAPLAQGGTVNSLISVLNTATTTFQAQTGSAFVSSPANAAPGENGGGTWARAIGGEVETDNTGVTTFAFNGAALAGNITCDTTTRQGFVGYQVGRDIAKLNWDGWNVHMGATAGYLASDARDKTPGGTFRSNTQIPFLGSYITATRGSFFADALVRWDYYNINLDDTANGLFGQNFNARGWSIGGNIGYNVALPNNWFIEPSAGFTYSRVEIDPLAVSGTLFTVLPTGVSLPGTVQTDDVKSELGRISVRVGTNFTTPYAAVQPFVTGSIYHEFAGDVTTTFVTAPAADPILGGSLQGSLTTDRIGTYGQVSAGVAGQMLNTGWLGYVRGDYRFGENVEGWTLNTGIRYQFTPEPLPAGPIGKQPIYKAPPIAVAAPVQWGGFYAGVNAGTLWGKTDDWTYVSTGASSEPKYAGALLGGQIGYNHQIGQWVLGVEGDMAWSNAKGSASDPFGDLDAFFFTDETRIDWFGTVTGRLGYAWERTLFFVKGGFAAAEVTQQTSFNPSVFISPAAPFPIPATGGVNGTKTTATGWTIGLGAEYALTANWSAKAEYLYYDLGTDTYTVDNGFQVDARERGGIARVGVNYRFSTWGLPVVARY